MATDKYIQVRLSHGAQYPFDRGATEKDWAHRAARGVLADLLDRRGVKNELDQIDDEVRAEVVDTLAAIIRHAHAEQS